MALAVPASKSLRDQLSDPRQRPHLGRKSRSERALLQMLHELSALCDIEPGRTTAGPLLERLQAPVHQLLVPLAHRGARHAYASRHFGLRHAA